MKLFSQNNKPLIMAHRGSQKYPENSLKSFQNAVTLNVDVIETDVHLTKDENVVVFHDDTLDRTTNGTGRIETKTLKELEQLDIGYNFKDTMGQFPFRNKGFKILTLDGLFEHIKGTQINIDIKTEKSICVHKVIDTINEFERQDNVIIASFHQSILDLVREKYPSIVTAAGPADIKKFLIRHKLFMGWTLQAKKLLFSCFQVPVTFNNTKIVSKKFISWARNKKKAVHVWTINDETEMRNLVNMGVDGIFTDYPAILKRVIEQTPRTI